VPVPRRTLDTGNDLPRVGGVLLVAIAAWVTAPAHVERLAVDAGGDGLRSRVVRAARRQQDRRVADRQRSRGNRNPVRDRRRLDDEVVFDLRVHPGYVGLPVIVDLVAPGAEEAERLGVGYRLDARLRIRVIPASVFDYARRRAVRV